MERTSGTSDRADINDVRLIGGVEWGPQHLFRQGRRIGFLEAGWVMDREVIYVVRPADSFTLRDAFMVRGGIEF